MKFRELHIGAYGTFVERTQTLEPGLQLIFGPNERGKSTIRHFIGDMLYGQKSSTARRAYDAAYELRKPWSGDGTYGGRLVYELDDGRVIEVIRSFLKETESIQVFDRTNGVDITNSFKQLRNHEVDFASAHLGLSKLVFLNVATLSHYSLDHIGDTPALAEIGDKMLSLTDSGEEAHSAEAATRLLEERIGAIGRKNARTKPLPAARIRLAELEEELRQARALAEDTADLERERADALHKLEAVEAACTKCEQELLVAEREAVVRRLQRAEEVTRAIEEATGQLFPLRGAAHFPVERLPELRRADTVRNTAESQWRRTQEELTGTRGQIEAEGGEAVGYERHISSESEALLTELDQKQRSLREHLEENEHKEQDARDRLARAESELTHLPDFRGMNPDPIACLNTLATEAAGLQRARKDETEQWEDQKAAVDRKTQYLAKARAVFEGRPEFATELRDFQVAATQHDQELNRLRSDIDKERAVVESARRTVPQNQVRGVICLIIAILLSITAVATHTWAVFIPAGLTGLATLWFMLNLLLAHWETRRADINIATAERAIETLTAEHETRSARMHAVAEAVDCDSTRALEAFYEDYREDMRELQTLEQSLAEQDQRRQDAVAAVDQFLLRIQPQFTNLQRPIEHIEEMPAAVSELITRYQEHRDAKRRANENREQLARLQSERAQCQSDLESCLERERKLALEAREIMRENGYTDENKHANVLTALRSYRIRMAQAQDKRGRVTILRDKERALKARAEKEQTELKRAQEAWREMTRELNVESLAQCETLAEEATRYRECVERRAQLERQLESILDGAVLADLRTAAAAVQESGEGSGREPEAIRADIKTHEADRSQLKDAVRDIDTKLSELTAGSRALNQIEEELDTCREQVETLEAEWEATVYAAALIDEVARDKHARIAPRMVHRAGEYLSTITNGAYSELYISRDLSISIRIPKTDHLKEQPETLLSKGTVDQLYLAMRLALLQELSQGGESVPMILDDPFANYDDVRLAHALTLLQNFGERHQILLFTCREDVVRAANEQSIAVVELKP